MFRPAQSVHSHLTSTLLERRHALFLCKVFIMSAFKPHFWCNIFGLYYRPCTFRLEAESLYGIATIREFIRFKTCSRSVARAGEIVSFALFQDNGPFIVAGKQTVIGCPFILNHCWRWYNERDSRDRSGLISMLMNN